jgi:hypothetical protein
VARWVETVIEGLTSEPIVLTGDFSQSYDAGQHNFSEWFLFEPRLDPGVSAQQLQELADQGVDQIVVYRSFSPDVVVYLSADACTCSAATGIAPCADVNSDGVRDDGCVWWACESGTCAGTDIVFADMGGEFGSCTPDGAADGNDRFHVLNCFANQDTAGAAGYPCEPTPPLALNVDAGGVFGNCSPDGVCDGHDAFHALNAFTGITTCSCPGGGPAPQPGPAPSSVQRAALRLAPPAQEAVGGDLVTVHAWLDSPLADLRGYQLHVAVSGGSAGTVQLVDIFMPEPGVFSSAGEPAKPGRSRSLRAPADEGTVDPGPGAWRAFNVQAGQMLAGLDGPGVSAGPGRLATFVLRVSADAAGTFAIELLADPGDAGQRTFLFPTPVGQGIDLEPGEPARIHVRPEGRD